MSQLEILYEYYAADSCTRLEKSFNLHLLFLIKLIFLTFFFDILFYILSEHP